MSDDKIWFLNTADGQTGPHSLSELKNMLSGGKITPDWFVWKDGLPQWQKIADTADFSAPAPPPAAPPVPTPPKASPAPAAASAKPSPTALLEKADAAKAKAQPVAKKKGVSKGLAVALVLIAVVGGGAVGAMYLAPDAVQPILEMVGLAAPPPPPVPKPQPAPDLDLASDEEKKKEEEAAQEAAARLEILKGYYEILAKREGVDWEKEGAIPVELVADQLAKDEDGKEIVVGLSFEDAKKKPVEGADIVVLDPEADKVMLIVAVDAGETPDAAKERLEALKKAIADKKVKTVKETRGEGADKKKPWALKRFGADAVFEVAGLAGAEEKGFDREFDLKPEEIETLKKWLKEGGPTEEGATPESEEAATDKESAEAPAEGEEEAAPAEEEEAADKTEEKKAAKPSSVIKKGKDDYTAADFGQEGKGKDPVPEGIEFVKHATTHNIHTRECRMIPSNEKRLYFTTLAAAKKGEFKLCKTCMKEKK